MPSAAAWCWEKNGKTGRHCEWYGEPWDCGSTSKSIGDWDDEGQQLVAWTKYVARSRLWGTISDDCYYDYGEGCPTGYKRLWCKGESSDEGLDEGSEEFVVTGTGRSHEQKSVVIDIELN
ncbi:hypothetical protein DL95DRAFT_463628 [Leptodontidium sp. 2 PMI_412]|nr:hypothetical protein DL95DRAFT_463628 [Leptodontidium sp. 2 PMI_412]